jgi:hypothetical protein
MKNDNKIIKTIVATESWGEDSRTIVLSFEVPDHGFDLIAACKKAALAYCKTEKGYEAFTCCNVYSFSWSDFEIHVPNSIMEQFGFRRIEPVQVDYEVDLAEQIVDEDDLLPDGDGNERIYKVSLVRYTEKNVPECGANIFVKTLKNFSIAPLFLLKGNIDIEEALNNAGCEGVGAVEEISDEEFAEEAEAGAELLYI